MLNNSKLSNDIRCLPIHEYTFMKSENVVFADEVRALCEQNACGLFGTSWACPPAVGNISVCKNRCLEYTYAFMFTTVNNLSSQYDMKEWMDARRKHEKVTDTVVSVFRRYDKNLLALSTEGCTLCKKMHVSFRPL